MTVMSRPARNQDAPDSPLRTMFVHVVVYVAVNGLIVSLWVVLVGSAAELGDVIADPSTAREVGFWPVFVILGWGTALLIHAGLAIAKAVSPSARRRRREARRRERNRRKIERQVERGRAKGEELLAKTAQVAMETAAGAVSSLRPKRGGTDDGASAPVPSGTRRVAVMFTDLSDSTGLAESMGDEAWSEVLGHHRRLVRACLRTHGGDEIGTQGDGFLVRHESPTEAVATAVAIQQAHATHRKGRDRLPDVRIGIHAGDAVHDDGDLIGQVVNVASRVTSVAAPGQILVTEPVADGLGADVSLADQGLHELRGVSRPRHLLAVVW